MDTDVLPILTGGDECLRRPASPIDSPGAGTDRDIANAFATLGDFRRRNGFGRALAAPQIGISRRLLAVDLGTGPFAVINPEITWTSPETFEVWDDCLSIPYRIVRVLRHRSISLTYRDERFRPRKWDRLPPDLSELLQHEIDHLDGILMLDRAHGENAIRPAAERALVDAARPVRRLSLERIAEAARRVDPVFLHSPQFDCEPLSERLGTALTLKVETVNPIRSFKGRGADFFVSHLMERGGAGPLAAASAGNFGQAMAYVCRKRGIPFTVFTARDANPLKLDRMRALGAAVRPEWADFDAAKEAAREWAKTAGATMVEDGAAPEVSEGAGSIAVELLARGDAIDALLVPLGDGALLNGIGRWVKAASPATRVIGVCSGGAPAMAESWRGGPGAPIVSHESIDTIADGIAVRIPVPEAVADMHGIVDDVLLVDDQALLKAMRLVHRHAGLVLEPSGAAGIAGLLTSPEAFLKSRVATILTGGNITLEQQRTWLEQREER